MLLAALLLQQSALPNHLSSTLLFFDVSFAVQVGNVFDIGALVEVADVEGSFILQDGIAEVLDGIK